jgi:hypothetical protein
MTINIVGAAPKATVAVAGAHGAPVSIPKRTFPGKPRTKGPSQWTEHFRQLLSYTTFVKDEGGNIVAADAHQTVHAVPLFAATGVKATDNAASRLVKHDVKSFKETDANGHGLKIITRYLERDGSKVLYAWRTLPEGVTVA